MMANKKIRYLKNSYINSFSGITFVLDNYNKTYLNFMVNQDISTVNSTVDFVVRKPKFESWLCHSGFE